MSSFGSKACLERVPRKKQLNHRMRATTPKLNLSRREKIHLILTSTAQTMTSKTQMIKIRTQTVAVDKRRRRNFWQKESAEMEMMNQVMKTEGLL